MESSVYEQLPQHLLPWYRKGHRDLPWRKDREPYHIWISEIMLQQTRVEAVKGYYTRFLKELPTIEALAACEDDQLNKLWEGLGYYSRVRNLKKAAIKIVDDWGGVFPNTYQDVLALPGIGTYTAGAICSIAFDLQTPAVDGNVLRVISRLTEDSTPIDLPAYRAEVRRRLSEHYPKAAGEFTQALMELGATLCGPNWKPQCSQCPCCDFCGSAKHATTEKYPVRLPKKKRKTENRTVLILSCDGRYAVEKRPEKGLLAGLWQFPNVSGTLETEEALKLLQSKGLHPQELLRQVERKHIFTHILWKMRGIYVEVAEMGEDFQWLTAEQIRRETALPTAFRQFWKEIDSI